MPKRKKRSPSRKKGLDRGIGKKLSRGKNEVKVKYENASRSVEAEQLEAEDEQDYIAVPDELGLSSLDQKPKRGRRTTSNDFLRESRDGWLYFFEGFWQEIGWPLLQIRTRGTATTEEIRSIFEPTRQKIRGQLANCFLGGSPEPGEGKGRRANKIKLSELYTEIGLMRSEYQDLTRTCGYAETALKEAEEHYKEAIQMEVEQKKQRLVELTEKLRSAEDESKRLDEIVSNQQRHFYCSEVLDFLCKGKYAVKPLSLANSLAGLPQMGWRQSLARCSKMAASSAYVQYPYGILQAILKIWKRRSKNLQLSIIDLFRVEIRKLPKKNESRTYLAEDWRDLCMAIDRCSKEEHSDGFMPYALTQAFVNYRSRTKSQADQILDGLEKLPT